MSIQVQVLNKGPVIIYAHGGGWRKLRGGSEFFWSDEGGASRKNFLFEGGALKIRIYKKCC